MAAVSHLEGRAGRHSGRHPTAAERHWMGSGRSYKNSRRARPECRAALVSVYPMSQGIRAEYRSIGVGGSPLGATPYGCPLWAVVPLSVIRRYSLQDVGGAAQGIELLGGEGK